jgi:hypothetical protein
MKRRIFLRSAGARLLRRSPGPPFGAAVRPVDPARTASAVSGSGRPLTSRRFGSPDHGGGPVAV